MISDLFQPPHDTVDDVEPLCSACGGDCDGFCAGNFATAQSGVPHAPDRGSLHPGNGALSTRCECGDADCFMEGP